jgi:hypothetical protein
MEFVALPLSLIHRPLTVGALSVAVLVTPHEVAGVLFARQSPSECTLAVHLPVFICSCICLVMIVIQPSSSVRSHATYEPTFIQEIFLETQPNSFTMR